MTLYHNIHAMFHYLLQLSFFLKHTKHQILPSQYYHLVVLCCIFDAKLLMTLSSHRKGAQSVLHCFFGLRMYVTENLAIP